MVAIVSNRSGLQNPGPGLPPSSSGVALPEQFQASGRVKRVVDGDTIHLEDGTKIRYIGIDTPETVHPSKPVQCMGKEASARNKELVGGKEVFLELDVEHYDRYKRLLAYVYVKQGEKFQMVNELLVAEGFAKPVTYPPNIRYSDKFREVSAIAREKGLGLYQPGVCD